MRPRYGKLCHDCAPGSPKKQANGSRNGSRTKGDSATIGCRKPKKSKLMGAVMRPRYGKLCHDRAVGAT